MPDAACSCLHPGSLPPLATSDPRQNLLAGLIEHGLLVRTDVTGVYEHGAAFADVLARVSQAASEAGRDLGAERKSFPPVISRALLERTDYLKTFPHLAGALYSFFGTEREHLTLLGEVERGEPWSAGFAPTPVALTPAACYPIYPSATGILPPGGRTFEVESWCFRHEPSDDPARMQSFRMREFVRLGAPDDVQAFRDEWIDRGEHLLYTLGLEPRAVVANDPFFGRSGRVLAQTQRDEALKFELVVPITAPDRPTAVISCNCHRDHFGTVFDIHTADGEPAHSACVGFGLERITLALFRTHGPDQATWPAGVRHALGW